nr:PREDICTED: transcription factor HES-7.1-B-like [Paralichthys olivaceus]
MKSLSSPESPRQRTMRRVPKPLMEKRRRERINHSLETLRVLMLKSTQNEKLKNPKVEKAEILESVVQFLRTENDEDRVLSKNRACGARQHSYHEGMRSCLLRVSHFIATKSQEAEDADGDAIKASLALPEAHTPAPSPEHIHKTLIPAVDSTSLAPRAARHHSKHGISHPYLTGLHCESTKPFSSNSGSTHITDPVWRPWPQ